MKLRPVSEIPGEWEPKEDKIQVPLRLFKAIVFFFIVSIAINLTFALIVICPLEPRIARESKIVWKPVSKSEPLHLNALVPEVMTTEATEAYIIFEDNEFKLRENEIGTGSKPEVPLFTIPKKWLKLMKQPDDVLSQLDKEMEDEIESFRGELSGWLKKKLVQERQFFKNLFIEGPPKNWDNQPISMIPCLRDVKHCPFYIKTILSKIAFKLAVDLLPIVKKTWQEELVVSEPKHAMLNVTIKRDGRSEQFEAGTGTIQRIPGGKHLVTFDTTGKDGQLSESTWFPLRESLIEVSFECTN